LSGGEKARILDDSEPQRPAPTPGLWAGRHEPIILKKLVAREAKISGREITITGGNDVALTVTLGLGQGQVTGVVELDGKPAARVMVLLCPSPARKWKRIRARKR